MIVLGEIIKTLGYQENEEKAENRRMAAATKNSL